MIELAEIVTGSGWPLAATLAAVVAAQELQVGRRRSALNRALHELRRPLQAIALAAAGDDGGTPTVLASSVQLAGAAIEQLDRELNGDAGFRRPREPIELRPLLEAAVRRWQAPAALAGGSLSLRWRAGQAQVVGDRVELSQALDNLLLNAIEHGGPTIAVDARLHRGRVRIVIADSGRASRPKDRRETPAEAIDRLAGRRRRGHGLTVVRRVAASHHGRFALRRSERGSLALFELPLTRRRSSAA